MSDSTCGACCVLRATSGKRRFFFPHIRVLKKSTHSCLPVYARQKAATFDTHFPRNASNVFEVTTFSGTVRMARVGTSRVDIQGPGYLGEYV